MEAMRHSLTEWLIESQGQTKKKLGAVVEAMKVDKVEEGSIQSGEYQESLIKRNEASKFHSEMESKAMKMKSYQVPVNDKLKRSVEKTRRGSTRRLTILVGLDERGMNDVDGGLGGRNKAEDSWVGVGYVGGPGVSSGGPGSTIMSIASDKHDNEVKVNTPHQLARFDKIMVYKFHENEYGKFSGIFCYNFKNILNTTKVFDEIPVEDKVAFDDTRADRVDIISLSVGGSFALDEFDDLIVIGAFHSMKNGILTSYFAGNSGPDLAKIINFFPWYLSVVACTIDKKFIANVQLGNNKVYGGLAVNTFNPSGSYPIVYGGDMGDAPNSAAGFSGADSRFKRVYVHLLVEDLQKFLGSYLSTDFGGEPVEQVFINSVTLPSGSAVEFLTALCNVSAQELRHTPARVFSLQKLVEISYYNMSRIRMVCARIWSVMANHFISAGSHHDEKMAIYAIDSLRQLGMKYLERSELANYSFQNEILKPIVILMRSSHIESIRRLTVDYIVQMIKSKVRSIKSGWQNVFMIFIAAASDKLEPIIESAFGNMKTELIDSIILSQWTWATKILQSSNVAWQYGVSGPFWYTSGTNIQVLLFGVIAIEIKRKSPQFHVVLVIFVYLVYTTNSKLGSLRVVYRCIMEVSSKSRICQEPVSHERCGQSRSPVSGNYKGTYLTMLRSRGLVFGMINIVDNFGTIFVDKVYWAASYGREDMVVTLLSKHGCDGLASYLAEKGLLQHFINITITENVRGSLQISRTTTIPWIYTEEELYLKDNLAAYRTIAHAVTCIHDEFRGKSLKVQANVAEFFNSEDEACNIIAAMKMQHVYRNHGTRKKKDDCCCSSPTSISILPP